MSAQGIQKQTFALGGQVSLHLCSRREAGQDRRIRNDMHYKSSDEDKVHNASLLSAPRPPSPLQSRLLYEQRK